MTCVTLKAFLLWNIECFLFHKSSPVEKIDVFEVLSIDFKKLYNYTKFLKKLILYLYTIMFFPMGK